MAANLIDVLMLLASCGALLAIATVGVVALPWTDDELVDTSAALRDSWRWLDRALQRTGERIARARGLPMQQDEALEGVYDADPASRPA